MLKDLIKNKGYSVYKFSKLSGIPYSTINELVLGKKDPKECSFRTVYAIAKTLNMSLDELGRSIMEPGSNKATKAAGNWEEARKKKYIFPIIVDCKDYDAFRIHPLKQKEVNMVYNAIKENKKISELYVFGGSTTIRCTRKSDIDFAVGLCKDSLLPENKYEISEMIEDICNYNADIIWLDSVVKESALEENIKRGVKLI